MAGSETLPMSIDCPPRRRPSSEALQEVVLTAPARVAAHESDDSLFGLLQCHPSEEGRGAPGCHAEALGILVGGRRERQ